MVFDLGKAVHYLWRFQQSPVVRWELAASTCPFLGHAFFANSNGMQRFIKLVETAETIHNCDGNHISCWMFWQKNPILEGLVARQDFIMHSERSGSMAYTPPTFPPFITYEAWVCQWKSADEEVPSPVVGPLELAKDRRVLTGLATKLSSSLCCFVCSNLAWFTFCSSATDLHVRRKWSWTTVELRIWVFAKQWSIFLSFINIPGVYIDLIMFN